MSDHNDDADEGTPSMTLADQLGMIAGLPDDTRKAWLLELDQLVPELGIGKAYGAERNAYEVTLWNERNRQRAREQVEEERLARSGSPLQVVRLGEVAEQLDLGLIERPAPSIGGLLYPGRVNTVYGDPTAGKTWFALTQARAVADAGGKTLFLDYEDTEVGLADRCLAMDPKLAGSILYLPVQGASMQAVVAEARKLIRREDVRLFVIDSTGMSMASVGLNPYVDDDTARWFAALPYPLAQLGPAGLLLDHVPKSREGTPTPVGSFRKSAAITGAQFWLDSRKGFSKTQSGWSRLVCTKDRCGTFATGDVVGRVTFDPWANDAQPKLDVRTRLGAGDGEPLSLLTPKERAVREFVEECWETHGTTDENGEVIQGRPTFTQVRSKVGGKADTLRPLVDGLVTKGWLREVVLASGPKRTLTVYEPGDPFADAGDPDDLL